MNSNNSSSSDLSNTSSDLGEEEKRNGLDFVRACEMGWVVTMTRRQQKIDRSAVAPELYRDHPPYSHPLQSSVGLNNPDDDTQEASEGKTYFRNRPEEEEAHLTSKPQKSK